MAMLRKYGVAASICIPIPIVDDTDFAATGDWTPATGDVKVSKDEGNVANIGTLPTAVGGTGSVLWDFTLSATEMQAARIVIQIVDAAVENQAIVIETYGNASAQHAADLDDSVRLGLTALPNAAADAAGGLPISDAGGLDLDGRLDADVSSRNAVAPNTVVPPTVAQMDARTLVAASYFDPAADTVANVTTVATTTTNTDMVGTDGANTVVPPSVAQFNARSILAADYFDPAADAVANVTLVGTTTANTDMVTEPPTAVENRQEMDSNSVSMSSILQDTNELQSDWANGGRLDLLIDAIKVVTDAIPEGGAMTTIDANVDAIKVITDALGATAAARLALSAGQMIPFTVDTATNTHTPTTTEFQADDITEATADHYGGRLVVWTSGVLAGQVTDVVSPNGYVLVGGIGQFTVTALTEAPTNDDTGILV